jgi:thiol-disulfide isomerase/thioredoxin
MESTAQRSAADNTFLQGPSGRSEPASVPTASDPASSLPDASGQTFASMSSALGVERPQRGQKPKWPVYLAAVVLIFLAGAVIVLGSRFWDPMWNPFRPSPEAVIAAMADKMAEAKTWRARSEFSTVHPEFTNEEAKIHSGRTEDIVSVEEAINRSDEGIYSRESKFKESFNRFDPELSYKDEGDVSNGELKEINGDMYYKTYITAENSSFSFLSDSMSGKWIKFSEFLNREISAYEAKEAEDYGSEMSAVSWIRKTLYRKENSLVVKGILTSKTGYTVTEELPDDKVGGVEAYHYKVSFNDSLLKDLAIVFADEDPASDQAERIRKNFDKLNKDRINFFGEVWIGKKDGFLYRVKGEIEVGDNDFQDLFDQEDPRELEQYEIDYREETKDSKYILKGDINFFDFDRPADIVPPSEFIMIEDAIQKEEDTDSAAEKSLAVPEGAASNAVIKSYMDQFRTVSILYQMNNDSYLGLANNGESNLLMEKINSKGNLTLKTSVGDYCAYTPLVKTEDDAAIQYWCIDSSGFSGSLNEDPGKEGYCDGKTFRCDQPVQPVYLEPEAETQPQTEAVGNFTELTSEPVCYEDGKPIIYLFGSESCPHCKWEQPILNAVIEKFQSVVSFHDNIDSYNDQDIFSKYSSGAIPTIVIGCKYYRIGSGESFGEGEEKRKEAEEEALTELFCKTTNDQPESICLK